MIGTYEGSGEPAALEHWNGDAWTVYTRAGGAWVAGTGGTFDGQLNATTQSNAFQGYTYHFDGSAFTAQPAAPANLLRAITLSPTRVWTTGLHALYSSAR